MENFCSGCLLLQRLPQLGEEPRVLDGDDGLLGKITQQLDLLRAERPNFLAVDDDGTDQLVFFYLRYSE